MFDDNWKNWQYKNTALLISGLFLFIYFIDSPAIQNTLKQIGSFGYLGAFFSGIFFVSVFTVAPASVVLYDLAENLNPLYIALAAGSGAVIGDYIIFRFLRDRVFEELNPIYQKMGGSFLKKIFLSPFFAWLIPIAGALIIASPLPDEAGITLLGLSKVKNWHFILITFLLNSIGILLVIVLSKSF